jgi:VanZ family protein
LSASRKEVVKTWIAAIVWLILIAIESTTWLSSDETSRILYPIFHFLTGVDAAHFVVWHFYIRKSGHVVGYFVCSWLLFGAWRATLRPSSIYRRWAFRWALIAWLMTTTVASLDEWHQTYLPGRTGTWHDVVLDSSAALLAQILIFLWCRRRLAGKRAVVTNSVAT